MFEFKDLKTKPHPIDFESNKIIKSTTSSCASALVL